MEAAAHPHPHHEMPTSGSALTSVAFSATLHCLTGCAIGEVTGMAIGTALGFSNFATIALAVALAFLFGYTLTSLPLLRAGLALAAVIPIALATDTVSIAIMEIVDNAIMLAIPGAMHAGLGDLLFWGALSVALVIAGAAALPVNRWLITRGKGHAVLHETGIHGGPPTRVVAAIAAVAAVFGTVVLVAEAVDSNEGEMAGHQQAGAARQGAATGEQEAVRGLAVNDAGMTLALDRAQVEAGRQSALRFQIVGSDGRAVRDFAVEHEKRMHLIVVRRDLTGFQHLHPQLDQSGTWATPLTISEAGSYRVFADFKRRDSNQTLAADLAVDGPVDWQPLPPPANVARTTDGYEVRMSGTNSQAGGESELRFAVHRDGREVEVEPYLGAGGHLVALREGDLAYLHVHPTGHGGADPVAFATEFPSGGRYRLFLQFKHDGRVHTAAFTREVTANGRPTAQPRAVEGGEAHGH
jgi:hypothetical protein